MKTVKWLALGIAAAAAAATLGAGTAASADPGTILKFDSMAPVTGPYVGAANPIRELSGGGLPWMISSGMGILQRDGHLVVHVRGLVLADRPPVPPGPRGTNPIADFQAIVSCQSISPEGTATVTNVSTGLVPASSQGDADIETTVALPSSCIAPVVFVASPGGAWFAATGN
jgi:hypothetical protein